MASQISMDEIVKCVLDGLENAHKEYSEWSDGEYIWNAPEYLLTVNIAKELKKSKEVKFLTLEDNVEDTIANARGAGRMPPDLRKDGRFDIVLWGSDKNPTPPIAIVEVKNKVYCFDRIEKDIKRIQALLGIQSTIEFGLMAFYATNTYRDFKDLDNKFNGIIDGLLKNTQECLKDKSGKEQFCIEKFERHIQDNDNMKDDNGYNVYRPIVFKIQKK